MKYLEELEHGDCFKIDNKIFVLTSDFKNNNTKLCYDLQTGNPKWMKDDTMVDICPLLMLNEDNNIIPVKNVKAKPTNSISQL